MTKQVKYFILAALFIVFMMVIALVYPALKAEFAPPAPSQEDTQPQPLPDFNIENRDGEIVSIKDFKGKPTVINFWASWCGPCKEEMPLFEQMFKDYGEDVNFVMINFTDNSRETKASADEFIAENKYTFPYYYDSQNLEGAVACEAYSVPTTIFINADGEVVAGNIGKISEETFSKQLSKILK